MCWISSLGSEGNWIGVNSVVLAHTPKKTTWAYGVAAAEMLKKHIIGFMAYHWKPASSDRFKRVTAFMFRLTYLCLRHILQPTTIAIEKQRRCFYSPTKAQAETDLEEC